MDRKKRIKELEERYKMNPDIYEFILDIVALEKENEKLKKEVKRITKLYWKLRNDEVKEIEKKIFGD